MSKLMHTLTLMQAQMVDVDVDLVTGKRVGVRTRLSIEDATASDSGM